MADTTPSEKPAMELKVVERGSNHLVIELVGEGHTFCNALQDALLKDEAIEFAGYTVPHPLISSARLTVQTKNGQDPVESLKRAAARLKEQSTAFRVSFEEAVKQRKT